MRGFALAAHIWMDVMYAQKVRQIIYLILILIVMGTALVKPISITVRCVQVEIPLLSLTLIWTAMGIVTEIPLCGMEL